MTATTDTERPNHAGHIPLLDGVRGLAICLVLLHHETVLVPTNRLDTWFVRLAHIGWSGVDLFFVLSGFLITGILLDSRGGPSYFRNFYARRTLRIFPLYYAVVFASLIVIPHLPEGLVPAQKLAKFGRVEDSAAYYWLYLSNYAIAGANAFRHGILDVSWSLAIEEQFYLLWPLVVLWTPAHLLRHLCLALVVAALGTRVAMLAFGASSITVYVPTPARIDGLAAGALLACMARGGGLDRWRTAARWLNLSSAVVLCVSFVALKGFPFDHPWIQTAGYSAITLFFSSMLVLALTAPAHAPLPRILESAVLRMFGKYSYALYLFHLPLRAVIRDTFYGPERLHVFLGSRIPGQLLFYLLSTAAALSAAIASWNLYEKHFLKLKRFFPASEPIANPSLEMHQDVQSGSKEADSTESEPRVRGAC